MAKKGAVKKAGKKKAGKKKAAKKKATKYKIDGGCLCGAVRYTCQQVPDEILYCHCRMCQRASGAPVVAWAGFASEVFSYTKGKPRTYHSSPDVGVRREFCGDCGSQLVWRRTDGYIGINVGTLDEPGQFAPRDYHMCTESQLAWFKVYDSLPRY